MGVQNPNGLVLWEGASLMGGAPIVVLATGIKKPSDNKKTGPMIQVSILRADVAPGEAIRNGADYAICGECNGRHVHDGWCYVEVDKWVRAIWHSYINGSYRRSVDPGADLAGADVRIGAYGDPAAAPVSLWRSIVARAACWTAYTHQWRDVPELRELAMASVDTLAEDTLAKSVGWRPYYARGSSEAVPAGSIECPHETRGVQCIDCRLCFGNPSDARRKRPVPAITIPVHGAVSKAFKVKGLAP